MLKRTNIQQQLERARSKTTSKEQILAEVYAVLDKEAEKESEILQKIENSSNDTGNFFDFELLKSENIFHINQIEQICVNYRLRFLDTKYFKGKIPQEAIFKIKNLEKEHQTSLQGFKIIAPSKLFKLENADDPLLFAPMGNDYFYLIHKWGNDLHPLRKLMMWPFKHLENFIALLLVLSFVVALLIPDGLFAPQQTTTQFLMIFFFAFKWVAGLSIFYGFKKGKNFSSAIWRSKYYNA